MACCVAGTTVLFLHKLLPGGKWSLLKVINGCLIGEVMRSPPASRGRANLRAPGMVSICAGCNGYYPWATAIISFTAAVIYIILSR